MKKDLLKQLQSYSAIVAGLIAADAAQGQIVYTDVNPDEDVNGNFDALNWQDETAWATYQIDLDDDGNVDYTLRVRSDQQHGAGFLDPTDGNFYINNPNDNPFATPLEADDEIGSGSEVWKGLLVYPNGYNYLGTLTTLGKTAAEGGGGWTGATDKYLGLKFKIGSNTHYGWARMDVRDDSRVYTLKDFAYQSTPDTPILAGQMVTGINNELSRDLNAYTSGKILNVVLNNDNAVNSVMKLYNITGQEILSAPLKSNRNEFVLDVPSGVYFVKVALEGGIYTKKVLVN